jgi:hypothetical protein
VKLKVIPLYVGISDTTCLPAAQDSASRADDCRMIGRTSRDAINDSCTLYAAQCGVIESESLL